MWKWPALQRSHFCPEIVPFRKLFLLIFTGDVSVVTLNILLAVAVGGDGVAVGLVVEGPLGVAVAGVAAAGLEVEVVGRALVALGPSHSRPALTLAVLGTLQVLRS